MNSADIELYFEQRRSLFEKNISVVNQLGPLDEDGYPRQECLEAIAYWCDTELQEKKDSNQGIFDWMDFILSVWHFKSYKTYEAQDPFLQKPVKVFELSTGGWSGNEEIISAMKRNLLYWQFSWHSHTRGGHYVFMIKLPQET